MTTLHVDLFREWRGGQSQALSLVQGLLSRGHEAELVAVAESPLATRGLAAGVRVHTVPGACARAAAAVRIARSRAEVIHCHDAHAVTSAWLASYVRPVRYFAARRVAYPLSSNGRLRYGRAARVIAISEFVKDSVVASGVSGDLVNVVYDGVELPDLSLARPDDQLLGCVGYLLPEKNQELLIRGLPFVLAQRPGCRMLLAGDGPSRPMLERLAAELGVGPAVEFAGFVHNVPKIYASLAVFLFPSIAEPLGSSLLAAMSWGLPVVALGTGAVPEVIRHGENGLLVDKADPRAMADAILRLLNDKELRTRLGAAARRTVEERFTAEQMTEETLAVYQAGVRRHGI